MSSTRETSTAATACCALLLAAACSAPPAPVANQNSPPQTAQVRDGLGPDVDTQQRRTSLFANWDAFVDPEGQPVVYEWSVGTQPGATDFSLYHSQVFRHPVNRSSNPCKCTSGLSDLKTFTTVQSKQPIECVFEQCAAYMPRYPVMRKSWKIKFLAKM